MGCGENGRKNEINLGGPCLRIISIKHRMAQTDIWEFGLGNGQGHRT